MAEDLSGKLIGPYKIEALLGKGGMAEVYKAYQATMERFVALKLMPRSPSEDKALILRFRNEARVLAKLIHPHILPIHDFGETEDYLYIAMPLIEGGTLARQLTGQALPLVQTRAIIAQVGDALDYAHEQGLVHRDIKPTNLLMDERGNCLLSDFGIAKILESATRLTRTGGMVGTPAYMSPEQGRGEKTDSRSDIYSLGVILYEMATGRVPFEADTPIGVVFKHIQEPLPPPRTLNPDLPEAVERVILKALAKDPADRYQTAGMFVRALLATASDTPATEIAMPGVSSSGPTQPAHLGMEPLETTPSATQPHSLSVQPALSTQPARPSARPVWLWPAIAVIAVTALVAAFLIGRMALSLPTPAANIRLASAQTHTPQAPALAGIEASLTPPTPSSTETPVPLAAGSTQISEKDGMVLVYIPAGEFVMGAVNTDAQASDDEKPQHTVYVDGFWMDRTETTNAMFARFVNETGYTTDAEKSGKGYVWSGSEWAAAQGADWQHPAGPTTGIAGRDNYPVVQVSWNDAAAYCAWAGRRLPTEAEWEKAARGTDGRPYPWGDGAPDLTLLNFNQQVGGTTKVGSYPSGASPLGLLDMAGNVWEWAADWYGQDYYSVSPAENPPGPPAGERRVLRGGGWNNSARIQRVTNREVSAPNVGNYTVGFRCALGTALPTPPPPSITLTPTFAPGATQIAAKDGMAQVYVPAGEFLMGSSDADSQADDTEKPRRAIYLDAFWMDQTEVTNAMFTHFVAATGYQTDAEKDGWSYQYSFEDRKWSEATGADWQHPLGSGSSLKGRDDHPVIHVSWNDTAAYCAWAGRRLPTEAEWEKAARGSDDRLYPWGDAAPDGTRLNFNRLVGDTTVVGHYPSGASPYGALDMAGNVDEWVTDWYGARYYRSAPYQNPRGPESGQEHVTRGAAWINQAAFVRAADRGKHSADFRSFYLGFRCALSAPTPAPPTPPPVVTPQPPVAGARPIATRMSAKDSGVQALVPAGEFLLGSTADDFTEMLNLCPACDPQALTDQSPQRRIYLDEYWIDLTEVTNAMFATFVAETGHLTTAEREGKSYVVDRIRNAFGVVDGADWRHPAGLASSIEGQGSYPVRQVSWDDAAAYCAWAGRRLPTEAEWEKAARGTDGRLYPWGNAAPGEQLLNSDLRFDGPSQVGSYPAGASPYGAFDMAGNVWEWVADFYDATYYGSAPERNPVGPSTGQGHVRRGGSWASEHRIELVYLATTFRLWNNPSVSTDVTGFRCAWSETPPPGAPNALTPTATISPAQTPNCPDAAGPFAGLWSQLRDRLGCATGSALSGRIVEENFQSGTMFWREPLDSSQVLVLYSNGTWKLYAHPPFLEGSPEFACVDANTPAQSPPTPKRGFGAAWCDIPEIRSGLGNAIDAEHGYQGDMQSFSQGFALRTDTSVVYVFYNDGRWESK